MRRRQPLDPLRRERAVIDPLRSPGTLERRIRLAGPGLARRLQPRARHQRPTFPRTGLRRALRVVTPEPLFRTPRLSVVHALRNHQVRVRILAATGVDGERPWQPLLRCQRLREPHHQLPLLDRTQLHR